MEPGVRPAWAAMRGMVAPSTPCWPRTSAAALRSLRSDSRLRAWRGSRLRFLDFARGVAGLLADFRRRAVVCFIVLFILGSGGSRFGGRAEQRSRRPMRDSFCRGSGLAATACGAMGQVETVFSRNGEERYFGVNAELIRMDLRAGGDLASCC